MGFWREHEAVCDRGEAKRRSHEAVILVRAHSGQLAGLSTVGFMRLEDGRTFYAYRMFLRNQDRVPYLMVAVILSTRDFLRAFNHPKLQPAGLLHVNENEKLMRPGIRKLFARHGYQYWGQTPASEDVWGVEFGEPGRHMAPSTRWRRVLNQVVGCFGPRVPLLHFQKVSEESLNQRQQPTKGTV